MKCHLKKWFYLEKKVENYCYNLRSCYYCSLSSPLTRTMCNIEDHIEQSWSLVFLLFLVPLNARDVWCSLYVPLVCLLHFENEATWLLCVLNNANVPFFSLFHSRYHIIKALRSSSKLHKDESGAFEALPWVRSSTNKSRGSREGSLHLDLWPRRLHTLGVCFLISWTQD